MIKIFESEELKEIIKKYTDAVMFIEMINPCMVVRQVQQEDMIKLKSEIRDLLNRSGFIFSSETDNEVDFRNNNGAYRIHVNISEDCLYINEFDFTGTAKKYDTSINEDGNVEVTVRAVKL